MEYQEIIARVCEIVSDVTGKAVTPDMLRSHRTKCAAGVAMANRLLCHTLHSAYALPWGRVAKVTGMSADRARKLAYGLSALAASDKGYKEACEMVEEEFFW